MTRDTEFADLFQDYGRSGSSSAGESQNEDLLDIRGMKFPRRVVEPLSEYGRKQIGALVGIVLNPLNSDSRIEIAAKWLRTFEDDGVPGSAYKGYLDEVRALRDTRSVAASVTETPPEPRPEPVETQPELVRSRPVPASKLHAQMMSKLITAVGAVESIGMLLAELPDIGSDTAREWLALITQITRPLAPVRRHLKQIQQQDHDTREEPGR